MAPDEEGQDRAEGRSGAADAQAEVRRLLASAGSEPEPMPEHVASRLDSVIADLVADRAGASTPAADPPVVDLSQRRARRWPQVLVAAAAVSVVAVGVGNMVTGSGTFSSVTSGDGAGGAAEDAASARRATSQRGPDPENKAGARPDGAPDAARDVELPSVRSDRLRADAQRVVDAAPTSAAALSGRPHGCPGPPVARGDKLVDVRFDGERATMAVRDEAGRRQVTVYACTDSTRVLGRTKVGPGDGQRE